MTGALRLLLLGLFLSACDGTTGPREVRSLPIIEDHDPWRGHPLGIEAPSAVAPGETFVVKIHASGGGCDREGPVEREVRGETVTITPYTYTKIGVVCPDRGYWFTYEVPIQFADPGEGRIVVLGRIVDRSGNPNASLPPAGVEGYIEQRIPVQ